MCVYFVILCNTYLSVLAQIIGSQPINKPKHINMCDINTKFEEAGKKLQQLNDKFNADRIILFATDGNKCEEQDIRNDFEESGCPYCGSYEGDATECPQCGHGQ